LLHHVLTDDHDFFDYGCGRGDDVGLLGRAGIKASGWDPQHRPKARKAKASVVNLGYVVNVIEDPLERERVLRDAWSLTKRVLVVAARLADERDEAHVAACRDGWLTRRGTFQKFFEQDELGSWINGALGVESVTAGPGVFYVFRSSADRYEYLNSRFRRRVSLPARRRSDKVFEQHRTVLQPLIDFVAARGRLPHEQELDDDHVAELINAFGSVRQAFRTILWVTDESDWDRIRQERSVDLLVQIALSRFEGRPKFGALPQATQHDVRAFFSSYKRACEQSDRLLFATGSLEALTLAKRASLVGKAMPTAVYIHESALADLPALLRVYEGCARAFIGTIEGANVIKLSTEKPQISYLCYPAFSEDPHPTLNQAVNVDLRDRSASWRDYRASPNPPILHRKEQLVSPSHPRYETFARLTRQEERYGLLEDGAHIGTLAGWTNVLSERGLTLKGHRLIRSRSQVTRSGDFPSL
jgi:DNA phosphorothioation-associated putative methyltransferase